MLSKLVLPVCFHSMSLTNLSKFKLTLLIPTTLTYTNGIRLVHALEEQRLVPFLGMCDGRRERIVPVPRVGPRTTFSPSQTTVPVPLRIAESVQRAPAKWPAAEIAPYTEGGRVDDFVDDLISVFLDTPENLPRYTHASSTVGHACHKPPPRRGRERVDPEASHMS